VVISDKDIDGMGVVHKDVLKVMLEGEEPKDDPAMAKPGAKLQRLKEELQLQMAQRRADEWGRRLQEQRLVNEEEGNVEKGEGVKISHSFVSSVYSILRQCFASIVIS
jgi:hypothetical protein